MIVDLQNPKWPWPLKASVAIVCIISLPALTYYLFSFLEPPRSVIELGAQGDFFGGHIAAITSSLTLLVVLITGFLQQSTDRAFRLREHFLSGLTVIGQYDVANPGCEQALRFLDYYSRLAIELKNDELLLLLNTVITKEIRSKLEIYDKENTPDIYVYARTAKKQIAALLKAHHMERKGLTADV